MKIEAAIATSETDALIREREFRKGKLAYLKGKDESACPWSDPSLTYQWWMEGFEYEKSFSNQNKDQFVVCAAMRNDNGVIICSPRHFDSIACMQVRENEWDLWRKAEQGFVDQYGTFLTREEAWAIANKNNQVTRRVGGDEGRLFSENLY